MSWYKQSEHYSLVYIYKNKQTDKQTNIKTKKKKKKR